MDAEKNVVEAARAVVATRGWDLLGGSHEKIVALRAALSAYDSAPAPSEDRVREAAGEYEFVLTGEVREPKVGEWYVEHYGSQVATIDWPEHKANKRSILHRRVTPAPAPSEDRVREAAGRCVRALLMDSRCTEGDRLAIKKRGSDGNEHDLGAWSHDAALNVIAEALRPYVTPAPALPAGTVVARLEWLRLMLTVAKQRDCTEIVDEIEGFLAKLPRPEPPKEFVAEWERIADTLYRYQIMSPRYDGPTKETHCARTVAALRAAWEADPKGKQ